jgi:membrane-associated phospholipid phosphatase
LNKFYQDKRAALICHSILALAVLPFIFLYSKGDSLLFINSHNSSILDKIMYHTTRLPELAYIVFIVVLGLFIEKRNLLSIVISLSLCGLLILLFKDVLFPHMTRPFEWLNSKHIPFHRVEGIRLHSNGSFPSGHSMSAFCSLALIGFASKKSWVQILLFLLAVLSGYSRIYVAQHYLMDVYTGALLGFLLAVLIQFNLYRLLKTPFWQKPLIQFKS